MMLKWIGAALFAAASMFGTSALAADWPQPEPEYPELPEVDYGLSGAFYLRGSVAGNAMWARNVEFCPCPNSATPTDMGWGYSFGAGAGYEFGNGFRTDLTVDWLRNTGLTANGYSADLRSTVALANVYYDFDLGGMGLSADGGWQGYVGAGLGKAWHYTSATHATDPDLVAGAGNRSWAGAVMAGVAYDMGAAVADIGYRALWHKGFSTQGSGMWVQDAVAHEIRASIRYRFY